MRTTLRTVCRDTSNPELSSGSQHLFDSLIGFGNDPGVLLMTAPRVALGSPAMSCATHSSRRHCLPSAPMEHIEGVSQGRICGLSQSLKGTNETEIHAPKRRCRGGSAGYLPQDAPDPFVGRSAGSFRDCGARRTLRRCVAESLYYNGPKEFLDTGSAQFAALFRPFLDRQYQGA